MPRGLISRIAAGGGPRRGIGGVASGSARGLLGEAADLLRLDPAASRAARPKSSSNTGGTRLHHHKAYTVRVDKPNAVFRRMLQQAIGGPEGEMRVMNQYLFQAWGSRGPKKYRDMLLHTGTEEIGHIEVLATAVAMNLDGLPSEKV